MKKIILAMIFLLLAGCTSLRDGGFFKDVFEADERNEVVQSDILLEKEDIGNIISEIRYNVKQKQRREYSKNYDYYKVYLGEFLVIPIEGEDLERVVSKPKDAFLHSFISENKFYFRSIYQGDYRVELYTKGATTKRINIKNILKYNINEGNLKNIIVQSDNNNEEKLFYDATDLYRMAFPEGQSSKEINLMLLNRALQNNQTSKMEEVLANLLKENFFSIEDKNKIIRALIMTGSKKELTDEFLTIESNDIGLNNLIKRYLLSRKVVNKSEIEFLEKIFKREPTKEISNKIGSWYNENGYSDLGEKYLTGELTGYNISSNRDLGVDISSEVEGGYKTASEKNYEDFKDLMNKGVKSFELGNYNDSILTLKKAVELNKEYDETSSIYSYIAEASAKTQNYSEATLYYKKAIEIEKNSEKKIENYYQLATAYNLSGEIKEYKKYLTFIRQRFPDTVWGRKSLIELNKLNKD